MLGALPAENTAEGVDVDRLSGLEVAQQVETERVECGALRGHHVLRSHWRLTPSETRGTNGVRIAKGEDPVAVDHAHDRIASDAARVHPGHRSEHVVLIDAQPTLPLQLVGEYVEQDF